MADRAGVALALPVAVWPPDDTEESVVGTDLHQAAIVALRTGLNEAAALEAPDGGPWPWKAGDQTMIRDFRRPDGSAYTTFPDVFVYGGVWDETRGSLSVRTDGAPLLIIEVLSKETHEIDLDLEAGKGYSYAQAGVREYLTLDPVRASLPDGGRGWRLEGGGYRPWRPNGRGRWASSVVSVAFGLDGVRAAVYARDGRRFLREGEVERALRERDERLREQERQWVAERQRREELEQIVRAQRTELDGLRRERRSDPPAT